MVAFNETFSGLALPSSFVVTCWPFRWKGLETEAAVRQHPDDPAHRKLPSGQAIDGGDASCELFCRAADIRHDGSLRHEALNARRHIECSAQAERREIAKAGEIGRVGRKCSSGAFRAELPCEARDDRRTGKARRFHIHQTTR